MKCEELIYDSRDGVTKIYGVKWSPDEGEIRGVIQLIHGMSEHIERYEGFARLLTSNGFVVVANEHLGHGHTAMHSVMPTYGYFTKRDAATVLVRDVHRLKKMTQQEYPGLPYIILGHSMGSYVLREYLTRYGSGIDAAILMGAGHMPPALLAACHFLCFFRNIFCKPYSASPFFNWLGFGTYNKRIKDNRTEYDWLTKDSKVIDAYIADPRDGFPFTGNGFDTLRVLITRSGKAELIDKIPKDLPIAFFSGAEDPVGDYGKGVQWSYNAFVNAGIKDVSIRLFENDRHEILNETDKDVVMQEILAWIEDRIYNKAQSSET